jgi:hypothetical protein
MVNWCHYGVSAHAVTVNALILEVISMIFAEFIGAGYSLSHIRIIHS